MKLTSGDQLESRAKHKQVHDPSRDIEREYTLQTNLPIIGFTSFLNDWSSEVVARIIPIYLAGALGAPATIVGLLQGLPDAISVILKFLGGIWSDKMGKYKPLVLYGYGISVFGRILLAFASSWSHLFFTKLLDRAGKGIRVSSREALLAESSIKEKQGAAFGLNRCLDTLGAMLGIFTVYLATLYLMPENGGGIGSIFTNLVIISCVPAAMSWLILLFFVLEPGHGNAPQKIKKKIAPEDLKFKRRTIGGVKKWFMTFPREFRVFLIATTAFSFGNGTDAFLLLRGMKAELALADIFMSLIIFNAVACAMALLAGKLSDQYSKKLILGLSWLVFTIAYIGFAFMEIDKTSFYFLFGVYGIFYGCADVSSKAFIGDLIPSGSRGKAFGAYNALSGIALFPATLISGILWDQVGHAATFIFGATMSITAIILLVRLNVKKLKTVEA